MRLFVSVSGNLHRLSPFGLSSNYMRNIGKTNALEVKIASPVPGGKFTRKGRGNCDRIYNRNRITEIDAKGSHSARRVCACH